MIPFPNNRVVKSLQYDVDNLTGNDDDLLGCFALGVAGGLLVCHHKSLNLAIGDTQRQGFFESHLAVE